MGPVADNRPSSPSITRGRIDEGGELISIITNIDIGLLYIHYLRAIVASCHAINLANSSIASSSNRFPRVNNNIHLPARRLQDGDAGLMVLAILVHHGDRAMCHRLDVADALDVDVDHGPRLHVDIPDTHDAVPNVRDLCRTWLYMVN